MGYLMNLLEVKRTTGNGEDEDLNDGQSNNDDDSNYNLDDETNNDPEGQHDIADGSNNYNLEDETNTNPEDDNGGNPPIDDNNVPASDNDPEHDTVDGTNNYNLEDETNKDPTPEDDNEIDDTNAPDNNDTNNYNLEDETNGEDNTSSDTGNLDGTDGQPVDPDAKIKEIEQSIGTLNPEQLKVQNVNLKKQYIELYNNCSNIIMRLNDVNKKSETEEGLAFAIQSVQDLKSIIYDYLIHTYDTKTFVQNSVNYTEYLVTLNSVNKLLNNLNTNKNVNNVKK